MAGAPNMKHWLTQKKRERALSNGYTFSSSGQLKKASLSTTARIGAVDGLVLSEDDLMSQIEDLSSLFDSPPTTTKKWQGETIAYEAEPLALPPPMQMDFATASKAAEEAMADLELSHPTHGHIDDVRQSLDSKGAPQGIQQMFNPLNVPRGSSQKPSASVRVRTSFDSVRDRALVAPGWAHPQLNRGGLTHLQPRKFRAVGAAAPCPAPVMPHSTKYPIDFALSSRGGAKNPVQAPLPMTCGGGGHNNTMVCRPIAPLMTRREQFMPTPGNGIGMLPLHHPPPNVDYNKVKIVAQKRRKSTREKQRRATTNHIYEQLSALIDTHNTARRRPHDIPGVPTSMEAVDLAQQKRKINRLQVLTEAVRAIKELTYENTMLRRSETYARSSLQSRGQADTEVLARRELQERLSQQIDNTSLQPIT